MRRKKLHRRMFLRAAGGVSLGLPLLNMFESNTHAQTAVSDDGFPLRFVVFFHPNGVHPPAWWPPGTPTERTWAFGPSLEPLAPHKNHVMILDGLNMQATQPSPGEPHQSGMGAILTGRPLQEGNMRGGDGSLAGWGSGISIDQVIAQHIGRTNPFSSLHFGVRASAYGAGSEVRSRMSYTGPAQPVAPEDNPVQMYNRLFSQLNPTGREMSRLRDRKVSVLDLVHDQFTAMERRAGNEDRRRLEQHAAQVSDLQARVQQTPVNGASCERPTAPAAINPDSAETMDRVSLLQIDMLVMSLACDLTRVATIQYGNGKNHATFPWLDSHRDDHFLGHDSGRPGEAAAEWSMRHQWYATQFAHMIARMREIPEGEGTMLDHTVILWVSELAHGNHSHQRMPFVTAGSLGGRLRPGRYLNFRGRPHNDLHVSLQNAFGIDSNVFGDPRFCNGALPGLNA